MGGSHLLSLYYSTRPAASRTKRLTAACLHPFPFRRYGKGSNEQHKAAAGVVVEERAASTAEEFERVLKANLDRINVVKEKERQLGVASPQTSEKVLHDDGADQETDCKTTDSVKENYKEPLGNFHNTAHEDD